MDSLVHFYHQRTPTRLSLSYPAPVITSWKGDADLEDKRRRFGRFVGLKGCDSPIDSEDMRIEINRWFEARIRKDIARENEREVWRRKGI